MSPQTTIVWSIYRTIVLRVDHRGPKCANWIILIFVAITMFQPFCLMAFIMCLSIRSKLQGISNWILHFNDVGIFFPVPLTMSKNITSRFYVVIFCPISTEFKYTNHSYHSRKRKQPSWLKYWFKEDFEILLSNSFFTNILSRNVFRSKQMKTCMGQISSLWRMSKKTTVFMIYLS